MKTEIKNGVAIIKLPENYPWEPVPDNTAEVMANMAKLATEARRKQEQRVYDAILRKESK